MSARKWTNLTISIVNCLFTVEYHFNDLIHSLYTDEQRHIYWEYKYLHTPIESMSRQNQILVRYYEEKGEKPLIYTEGIYINEENLNHQSELIKKPWEKFVKQEVYETNVENNNTYGENKKQIVEFESFKRFGMKNKIKKQSEYFKEDISPDMQVKIQF